MHGNPNRFRRWLDPSGMAKMTRIDGEAGSEACTHSAWTFARMEEMWKHLKPLTPYGKDMASLRIVYSDIADIRSAYDDSDAYERFVRRCPGDEAKTDRIGWHLGRIPRLPAISPPGNDEVGDKGNDSFDIIELFLFKKFLFNYSTLCKILDESTKEHFGLVFFSENLLAVLDKGGSDPETFQISGQYDPELKKIRNGIAELSSKIDGERQRLAGEIKTVWGLDFEGREFLTVPLEIGLKISASCAAESASHIAIEPYDEHACIARILPDAALLALQQERDALRDKERIIEKSIAWGLSRGILHEAGNFEKYRKAILRFDMARARYGLKVKFNLERPDLEADSIHVSGGRFLPLAWECERIGTTYTPLNVDIRHPAAVLFGSNMGGKTVVLQSLLFFQIMAQSGLFVPACEFSSRVFAFIEYVGEGASAKSQGLSGFGFEICSLSKVLGIASSRSCLVAFDEFAHTTSSEEAEALLSSVIRNFSENERCTAIFSTHFRGIERIANVHYFRMAGLDTESARRTFSGGSLSDAGETLAERVRNINTLMRYVVMEEDEAYWGTGKPGSDALEIAGLLGLDERILRVARERQHRE